MARRCSTHRDKVLRPCIMWNDTRSHAEAAKLDADPRFRKITGNIVFPGFTAPKLAWVKNNEPDVFAKVAKVLLPKDYLRLWLTGEHMSEMSDSAGTSWLDVAKRRWSPELLAATDLAEKQMPRLVEGTDPAGKLRAELASKWGLKAGIPVAGGAGDNAASACGMGTVEARPRLRLARHVGRAVRRQRLAICPIPKAPCTRSATRCRTPGTRWASSCRRPTRSTGFPASPAKAPAT